jgi:hypothetical protein
MTPTYLAEDLSDANPCTTRISHQRVDSFHTRIWLGHVRAGDLVDLVSTARICRRSQVDRAWAQDPPGQPRSDDPAPGFVRPATSR